MSKKQVAKPKEEEIKEEETIGQIIPEFTETRTITLDQRALGEIKKYVDFIVKQELEPIKNELNPIIQQLRALTAHGIRLLNLKPEDLQFAESKSPELSLPEFMKLDDIIAYYNAGKISLGRAAELSKLKYDVMIDELQKRGIKLKLGPENLDEAIEEEKAFRETMKRS